MIKELSIKDAETVSSNWFEGNNIEFIKTSIASIGSAGVYLNHELVSWAITTPTATINALFTKEANRRQGFAELTLKSISKLNAIYGLHSLCHVIHGNSSSEKLMEKVGFIYTNTLNWFSPCECPECLDARKRP